jgi:hypothetical protein
VMDRVPIHEVRSGDRVLSSDPQQPWKDISQILTLTEEIKDGVRLIFRDGWVNDYKRNELVIIWRDPKRRVEPATRYDRKDPL